MPIRPNCTICCPIDEHTFASSLVEKKLYKFFASENQIDQFRTTHKTQENWTAWEIDQLENLYKMLGRDSKSPFYGLNHLDPLCSFIVARECFASYFLLNCLHIHGTDHDRVLTTVCTTTTRVHRFRRMVHLCSASTPPSKYIRVRFHCAKTYVQCVSVPGQTVKEQNSS